MGRGGLRSTSFKKGCRGNPGGKPKNLPAVEARKIVADIKAAAREYTAEALEKVVAIMRSPKSPPASALGAATQILDRGWGKSREAVDIRFARHWKNLFTKAIACATNPQRRSSRR